MRLVEGACSYEILVPARGRAARARDASQPSLTVTRDRLTGYEPEIWFFDRSIILVATGREHASYRVAALSLKPDTIYLMRPGDTVHLCRTRRGLAFGLLRHRTVVVASGELSSMSGLSAADVSCTTTRRARAVDHNTADFPATVRIRQLSHTFSSPGRAYLDEYVVECSQLSRDPIFSGAGQCEHISIARTNDLDAVTVAGPEPILSDIEFIEW